MAVSPFLEADNNQLLQYLLLVAPPLAFWHIPYVSSFFPMVVIQLVWGVLMGPSGLGVWNPSMYNWLFSATAQASLHASANWGILLFILFTGLHIDYKMFIGKSANKEFWAMAIFSLLVPFAIGCTFGAILAEKASHDVVGAHGTRATFSLSIGITTGVTALPVLSAILLEMGQLKTGLGKILIMTATFHDMGLWILLTLVLGLIVDSTAYAGKFQPLVTFALVIAFVTFMIVVIGKGGKRLCATQFWQNITPTPRLMIHMCVMCVCSTITDLLQIHTMLGAVLYGAVMPKKERPFLVKHAELLNRALLLPLFFGSAGQKVVFTTKGLPAIMGVYFGTLLIVFGSLFTAVVLPAHFIFKRSWARAFLYFSYLVSKGIVEIVACTLLLQKGVINANTFAGLIMMALTCTGLTKPMVLLATYMESEEDKKERLAMDDNNNDSHFDNNHHDDREDSTKKRKSVLQRANSERNKPAVPESVQAMGVIQQAIHEEEDGQLIETAANNKDDDTFTAAALHHQEKEESELADMKVVQQG